MKADCATTHQVSRDPPVIRNANDSKVPRVLLPSPNPSRQGQGGIRLEGFFSRPSPEKPLISIVTVVFNGADYLAQTIGSVVNQTYENIEYIIVDGGSTDGSLEIIKMYESCISYWMSEPDRGIADAMNKGVQLCVGDYVLLLHADDYLLAPDVVARAVQHLEGQPSIVAFGLQYEHAGKRWPGRPRPWNWRMNFKTSVLHQAAFCHRALFEEIGGFDVQFRIAMDYDFFLRAYRKDIRARYVDIPLSVMRRTGISSRTDKESLRIRFREERAVHRKNLAGMWLRWVYKAYWAAYPLYRRYR